MRAADTMISTNELKTGTTIEIDGDVYTVVEFQHVKPGKGAAFVRTKIKNLQTGATFERTFRAGEKLPRARVERREMQFLYGTGDSYTFMDTENFEQLELTAEQLGDGTKYLKENMVIAILMYQGNPMGVDMPNTVELEVVKTEPGLKGDTVSGGSKPAVMETGVVVQVPLFIEVGERVVVDTRTGHYVQRA